MCLHNLRSQRNEMRVIKDITISSQKNMYKRNEENEYLKPILKFDA